MHGKPDLLNGKGRLEILSRQALVKNVLERDHIDPRTWALNLKRSRS